jgi:uncharacterized SAM-binding protein YcdF (DUF218 family)
MTRWFAAAGVLFLLAVSVLGWTAWEIAEQSERDEALRADVILVLGAAEYLGKPSPVLKLRLDHALDLYRRRLAPMVLVTGGASESSRFTEAEAARDYLVKNSVPAQDILLETEGTSTLQSIAASAEILDRMNMKSCIVVSDGYHIFRAKRMLEHRGVRAYGSPRHGAPESLTRRARLYVRQSAGYWIWRLGLAR